MIAKNWMIRHLSFQKASGKKHIRQTLIQIDEHLPKAITSTTLGPAEAWPAAMVGYGWLWPAMAGHGRPGWPWLAMAGHGWPWPAMTGRGHGQPWLIEKVKYRAH